MSTKSTLAAKVLLACLTILFVFSFVKHVEAAGSCSAFKTWS